MSHEPGFRRRSPSAHLSSRPAALIVLALGVSLSAAASPGAAPERAASAPSPVPESSYAGLRWRLLGPLRGGWSTCAEGVPGRPGLFYFGAADGGVWKTTDDGRTWAPVFDGQPASSIGALAIAPSNPDVIYAGTGQVETRFDIMDGNGVYRSADGGATWTHAGLEETRHIGRILVDPRDPDVVLVAALGHIYGPNPERGVFRSADGGRTWQKVLYVDDATGAVDLAADPAHPEVVFAATWQLRRHPWLDYHTPGRGPGSGIYKSADGGRTWTHLTGHGLPAGPMGRIGLAVAPTAAGGGASGGGAPAIGGPRVYATIDAGRPAGGPAGRAAGPPAASAEDQSAGLYRSDDGGATWKHVNPDSDLANSYFSRINVDPKNADTLYVMGRSVKRSTDGGATFTIVRGAPGGDDFHFMWIDPQDPRRMILASDQGTIASVNGGTTWSSWYNQPTGQFYHLGADDQFPYRVYSSQQDSGTAAVVTRSDYGQLTFRDWRPTGGEERDYTLPFPGDPGTVFVSGLGGVLARCDERTGRVENVSPWPVSSYARRPSTVKYRYGWITPIAISPLAPYALYQGAQVLFRSTDQGRHWETISPDLTGKSDTADDSKAGGKSRAASSKKGVADDECSGDVAVARARACGYGVILSIAPSPRERDQVWVGTDDGLIQLTRDGGKTWQDVTPHGLADWSAVSILDASAVDAATAYAAIDRHRVEDLEPHIYATSDFGRTWRDVGAGLPKGEYAISVRQDPVEPRLLYAGTRRGVYVSFDDGDAWQPLRNGLPATGVNDLLVHANDLLAATEGRSLWTLDDVTPLRQLARAAREPAPRLFLPAAAIRVRADMNRDTPLPPEEPTTHNPPAGVAIDYDLGPSASGPVTLEIYDAAKNRVRRFTSEAAPAHLPTEERYFAEEWVRPAPPLATGPGEHRVFWDLRGERPPAIEYEYSIAAVPDVDTPAVPQGALVPPGRYEVRLTAGDRIVKQPLFVQADPRARVESADLEAQHALYGQIARLLERAVAAHQEIESFSHRLREIAAGSKGDASGGAQTGAKGASARAATVAKPPAAVHDAAARLEADLAPFHSGQTDDNIDAIGRVLGTTASELEGADGPPSQPQKDVAAEYGRRLDDALARWQALRADSLPKIDALLKKAGLPPLAAAHAP